MRKCGRSGFATMIGAPGTGSIVSVERGPMAELDPQSAAMAVRIVNEAVETRAMSMSFLVHWYLNGATPAAVTDRSAGWIVITGPSLRFSAVRVVAALMTVPEPLLTMARKATPFSVEKDLVNHWELAPGISSPVICH